MSDINSCLIWSIIREYKPKNILEMSSSRGYTSVLMCEAVKKNRNGGKIVGIEPGFEWMAGEHSNEDKLKKLRKNVEPYKKIFTLVEATNDVALPKILDKTNPFDLIFIDSAHDEAMAKLYTEKYPLFADYLKPEGWLHIHDIFHHAGSEAPYIINWIEMNKDKFNFIWKVAEESDKLSIGQDLLGLHTGDDLEGAVWLQKSC